MKKLFLPVLLPTFALIGLFFVPATFAATIYSNPLTGSLTGFSHQDGTPVTDVCSTSANGLNCTTGTDIVYDIGFSNLKCVQADISGTGQNQIGLGDTINLVHSHER